MFTSERPHRIGTGDILNDNLSGNLIKRLIVLYIAVLFEPKYMKNKEYVFETFRPK